jgi:hypothetical protein
MIYYERAFLFFRLILFGGFPQRGMFPVLIAGKAGVAFFHGLG